LLNGGTKRPHPDPLPQERDPVCRHPLPSVPHSLFPDPCHPTPSPQNPPVIDTLTGAVVKYIGAKLA